ncbi:ThiF family adenylyltransferase [Streptomyces sp. NBC_00343]|uniref:ThiF family adenylyltransferase n=2 Tax=Streptomyces sp. NBC_00343 TaxID=2975719 RepID=UPI002E2A8C2E|nr:ThiF family adenylyltransferase [Streptomyces sp. NBC_00343]
MLINLLARAAGVIRSVHLVCPPDVPLAGRIVPLAPREVPLDEALLQGAQAIGAVRVSPASTATPADTVLVVGSGYGAKDRSPRFVAGYGWWGGVSSRPLPVPEAYGSSSLPFGPYLAATLAVAEVFLAVRLPRYTAPTEPYGWDCWSQTMSRTPVPGAPAELENLDLSGTALAGVGAVGSTWVHALWATPGLTGEVTLADADSKGITLTNLNRCPPFGHQHLGSSKAHCAAHLAADAGLVWHPHHARFERLGITPSLLVSAVDTNRARAELQNRYAPRMLSASTLDLRAETLRVGPPGTGACLRCYNPPEALTGDDELRARTRAGGTAAVGALAAEAGVPETEVRRWLERGECGEVGTRLLESLRRQAEPVQARFAVGFTSAMAGTLLGAETVKTLMQQPMRETEPSHNNVTFQFLRPTAHVNAASLLARDPQCPACAPAHPALDAWRRRAAAHDRR